LTYMCRPIILHLKNFKRWQGIIVKCNNFTFSYLGMEVDEGGAQ
jgi:hypothetical protein